MANIRKSPNPETNPKSTRPVIKRATQLGGEVRLIGGSFKRSKLAVLDRPGLRPTPDRVRETLFNWLGQDLAGWRVLDAFAGTGALGLEAASRAAAQVVLLDHDPALVSAMAASAQRLGASAVRAERAEALMWMGRCAPASFELVFIDPPFDSGLAERAALAATRLVVPGGYVFVEAAAKLATAPAGWVLSRHARAGAVHAHLWQRLDGTQVVPAQADPAATLPPL
jgi:16S rRNA (guanine966-N2)-methyltransferase